MSRHGMRVMNAMRLAAEQRSRVVFDQPTTGWLPEPVAPTPASPAEQVETSLFRVLAVLRLIVAAFAVVLTVARFDDFARPAFAVAALVLLLGWTAFVSWAYDARARRLLRLYVADLLVAVVLLLSTPVVQSEAMLDSAAPTMPSVWVMSPVLAWAAGRRWWEAVGAAVVVSVADISVRSQVAASAWGNILLLLLAAVIVGYAASILRTAAEMRAAAERVAATHTERARLARAVHDGVLQVLAMVQRHGAEAGGELRELARLAGEQEAALRRLVQTDARSLADDSLTGARDREEEMTDLMAALEPFGTARVMITGPGGPVEVHQAQARELTAVVSACLDNVARHVGEDAPAWVLVEDVGDAVVVSVRDEGPGIPENRLHQAAREGRLGVRESICGRMTDLGGRASLLTRRGLGTEWELTLRRRRDEQRME
jgi:signal transduction histidine kinase